MKKILIIGKTPPPIGGVTIHVLRLLDSLRANNVKAKFLPLSILNLLILPFYFIRYKQIHLHSSSIVVQNYFSIICSIFKIKSIITFHGDLNRFNNETQKKVKKIIKRTTCPIVLNEGSYELSKSLNKKTKLLSSFIAPKNNSTLEKRIKDDLSLLKKKYLKVFCTSATGITYDKKGNEIYGVIDLIDIFTKIPSYCLVICDSSAEYIKYCDYCKIVVPKNVYFISEPHSMYNVLELVDGFIRNTSTDGDSIAVKESLFLNKLTFATDVVSRPKGVILYDRGNYNDLIHKFNNAQLDFDNDVIDGSEELMNIYNE